MKDSERRQKDLDEFRTSLDSLKTWIEGTKMISLSDTPIEVSTQPEKEQQMQKVNITCYLVIKQHYLNKKSIIEA